MQMDKAKKLREAWGDKPCDHPSFSKEYMFGADTGDYVCMKCGKSFDRGEVEEIKKSREKEPPKK